MKPSAVWVAVLVACCCGLPPASADAAADDAMLFPWQGQPGRPLARLAAVSPVAARQLEVGGSLLQVKRSRTVNPNVVIQAVAEERTAEEGGSARERKLLADMGRLEREYEASRLTEARLQDQLRDEQVRVQSLKEKHEHALQARRAAERSAENMRLVAVAGVMAALVVAVWVQRARFQAWVASTLKSAVDQKRQNLRDGVTGGRRDAAMQNVCGEPRSASADLPEPDEDVEAGHSPREGLFAAACPEEGEELVEAAQAAEPPSSEEGQELGEAVPGRAEAASGEEPGKAQCVYFSLTEPGETRAPEPEPPRKPSPKAPNTKVPATPEDWWENDSPAWEHCSTP